METPKTKDVRSSIKPANKDELTAQLVAMKPFFMNEITRLKEALSNGGGSSFPEENLNTQNLKYQISLLQR